MNNLILELNMPGQSHSMVNGAFCKGLIDNNPNQTYIVCMDIHFNALSIRPMSGEIHHINFDTIGFREALSKTNSKLFRFLKVFFTLLKYIRQSKTQRGNIVFLSVNEYELVSMYFLQKIFPKAHFTAIMHGNLNSIKRKTGRNPYNKFFSYYRAIKRLKHPNIRVIVLEQWIKNNLTQEYPELAKNVSVTPHPIDKVIVSERQFDINKIQLGIAGILSPSKNIEAVIKLESLLNEEQQHFDKVKVAYWMYLPKEYEPKFPKALPIKLQDNWLQNADIENFYKGIDFIIWFHGVEKYYEYSASGILLDAVKFKKPLIALSCKSLNEIEKTYGKISISANTEEEIIKKLTVLTKSEYQIMTLNLLKLQQNRLSVVLCPP